MKILRGYFNVIENASKKASSDIFSLMKRDHRCPAVCVFKENMTSFLSDFDKAHFPQYLDEFTR